MCDKVHACMHAVHARLQLNVYTIQLFIICLVHACIYRFIIKWSFLSFDLQLNLMHNISQAGIISSCMLIIIKWTQFSFPLIPSEINAMLIWCVCSVTKINVSIYDLHNYMMQLCISYCKGFSHVWLLHTMYELLQPHPSKCYDYIIFPI